MMIRRERIRATAATHFYLFGDNLLQQGFGGQAQECRGEANAFGIPTKRFPSMQENAFFSDEEFDPVIKVIRNALRAAIKASTGRRIVILPNIGRGLSQLDTRAPRTFAALHMMLDALAATLSPPFGDAGDVVDAAYSRCASEAGPADGDPDALPKTE